MRLNGAEIFCECLLEQGVSTLFGYPGGAVLHIYDALYHYHNKLRHVMSAHEQGACHAADGYARLTGQTGVVLSTSGPGATNLVTGIATAYMDSVPLVAFTGNVATNLLGKDSFQEVYIAGITMPITKHNFVVRRVEDLAPAIRAAFRIAGSGRKGPVLIDIPKDISAAQCEYSREEPTPIPAPPTPNQAAVARIAAVLNQAERPLIYYGGGVMASGAGESLQKLCETGDIPATHTLMAAGAVRFDHPLNLGLLGMHGGVTSNRAAQVCDVLLILGARCSDRVALNPNKFAPNAVRLQIDVDRSEIGKNVLVDDSVTGDISAALEALLPLIQQNRHTDWQKTIANWRKLDFNPAAHCAADDPALHPYQIMRTISHYAGEDAVYVTDVGQHQLWAAQYCRHLKPRSFLTSGGLGTMGFGYGAAIGAAMADTGRPIVHITGDGSFHMNLNEACTAVSYHTPIVTVICDNRVLGMVRQWQKAFYGGRYSATDPERKTDFVQLAAGFGLPAFACETPAQFETLFPKALAIAQTEHTPVWLACRIGKDEKVLPMIPAGGTVDNIITE